MSWSSRSQKFLPFWNFPGKSRNVCGINGPRLKWANSLILIAENVWLGCVHE